MHPFLRRVIGITLIITAIFGLLFSVAGIVVVWVFEPRVETSVDHALITTRSVLDTSAEGLAIANTAMTTTVSSMDSLKGAVDSAAKTFNQITPLADLLTNLSKNSLPTTLKATQTSLNSAAESAKVVDDVLSALNTLPFVNKSFYNPAVPLHESLANVANSLDDYLTTLDTTQKQLADASGNLAGIQTQLTQMGTQIGNIGASVKEAQGVVEKYQALVKTAQERVAWVTLHLHTIMIVLAAITTLVWLWAVVIQLALYLQGLALVQNQLAGIQNNPDPAEATTVETGQVEEHTQKNLD